MILRRYNQVVIAILCVSTSILYVQPVLSHDASRNLHNLTADNNTFLVKFRFFPKISATV